VERRGRVGRVTLRYNQDKVSGVSHFAIETGSSD